MASGRLAASQLMEECGIEDPTTIDISLVAFGLDATVVEKPLDSSDARIVFGDKKTIITVNSQIEHEGRKRFALAHEIGHLRMHRNQFQMHHDTKATLEYFKSGSQETEANEFASELLMPSELFKQEVGNKRFSPDLMRKLSKRFKTSITSTVYKYFDLGNHPICLFYSYKNRVVYWKRPEGYPHFIIDYTKLAPPSDSVASEYFDKKTIYRRNESKQQIWKSTWFELKHWERDEDFNFYEYCIITPQYDTVLSVVWEE